MTTPVKSSLLVGGAALVLVLSACAPSGVPDDNATSYTAEQVQELAAKEELAGHTDQASALSDGVVSDDEYSAAFAALSQCATSQNVAVSEPTISPVSNDRYEFGYDYSGLTVDAALNVIDGCEAEHWTSVAMAYSFTREPRMNPDLMAATVGCLENRGLSVEGDTVSVEDLVNAVGESQSDAVTSCVYLTAAELYPDLKNVTVGY